MVTTKANMEDNLSNQPFSGSPAAKAFKEQLEKEEQTLTDFGKVENQTPLMSIPPDKPQTKESRAAVRKKVPGRARVRLGQQQIYFGKMIDISMTGASILCEEIIPSRKIVDLEIDIFHEGRKCYFVVQAIAVHHVLVGGKGYKIGLQFGPLTPEAVKSLGLLLESVPSNHSF